MSLHIIYDLFIDFVGTGNNKDAHDQSEIDDVLVSSTVERAAEPRLGQTKDYNIGICCFSANHTLLRSKNKDYRDVQKVFGH